MLQIRGTCMQIAPISTNNSQRNVQFKKLQIFRPHEWDVEVLEAVVKNESIRGYAKYLADKGKDLTLSCSLKPVPALQACIDEKWTNLLMTSTEYSKAALLKLLDEFDCKVLIKKEQEQEELEKQVAKERNRILGELDEFNKEITPVEKKEEIANAQVELQPQKRSLWKRLLGLK